MAPPPRQVRLTMDAFPDCPQEFRGTLERLLGLLNETQTAVSSALNKQLTRAENMRGGYVTISGPSTAQGRLVAQCRNPLQAAPRAVWIVRVERADRGQSTYPAVLASWRDVGDGMIEAIVVGLNPDGSQYRITLVVE